MKKVIKINCKILKEAILEYRVVGKELMAMLGEKFGYNILVKEEFEELIWKGNDKVPRKGQLTTKWNFTFHGGQCRFHNNKYKQTVEVELVNPPNFGKLDAWFVLNYLESTEKYKVLVDGIEHNLIREMIDKLYESGEVENIQ